MGVRSGVRSGVRLGIRSLSQKRDCQSLKFFGIQLGYICTIEVCNNISRYLCLIFKFKLTFEQYNNKNGPFMLNWGLHVQPTTDLHHWEWGSSETISKSCRTKDEVVNTAIVEIFWLSLILTDYIGWLMEIPNPHEGSEPSHAL